jgi:alpha-D-ribose 1-methylphosphonate 5-triphosphate synthase subunit PhnH
MTLQLTKKHGFDVVFDSQKGFRLILEAMSNPIKTVNIKEHAEKLFGDHPALLAVAMTLLDNEVSFNTCENRELSDEIASLTLAGRVQIEAADFIFVCDSNNIKDVIENAKCGTLADPQKSATVIIRNDGKPDCRMTLFGPGIDGNISVDVSQTVKDAILLRDAQNYEYPQGIDLIFISSDGELFTIPRLTREVR